MKVVGEAVAANLRRLRQQQRLTLSDLARRSKIGKATLSNLEAGRGNPTLETLWALAGALDVSFSQLVLEPEPESVQILRVSHSPEIHGASVDLRLLDRISARGTIELYEETFDSGSRREATPHGPGVIEHLLVTHGRLLVGPIGSSVELERGDFVRFSGDTPHVYAAIGGSARAAIVMNYPAGSLPEDPSAVFRPLVEGGAEESVDSTGE